jgi:hypothetical protein
VQQKRTEHLFIVRLWREADGDPGTWRGSIEHVATRQRQYFSDVDSLTTHITNRIEAPSIPSNEEPARRA